MQIEKVDFRKSTRPGAKLTVQEENNSVCDCLCHKENPKEHKNGCYTCEGFH